MPESKDAVEHRNGSRGKVLPKIIFVGRHAFPEGWRAVGGGTGAVIRGVLCAFAVGGRGAVFIGPWGDKGFRPGTYFWDQCLFIDIKL